MFGQWLNTFAQMTSLLWHAGQIHFSGFLRRNRARWGDTSRLHHPHDATRGPPTGAGAVAATSLPAVGASVLGIVATSKVGASTSLHTTSLGRAADATTESRLSKSVCASMQQVCSCASPDSVSSAGSSSPTPLAPLPLAPLVSFTGPSSSDGSSSSQSLLVSTATSPPSSQARLISTGCDAPFFRKRSQYSTIEASGTATVEVSSDIASKASRRPVTAGDSIAPRSNRTAAVLSIERRIAKASGDQSPLRCYQSSGELRTSPTIS